MYVGYEPAILHYVATCACLIPQFFEDKVHCSTKEVMLVWLLVLAILGDEGRVKE